ncbi:MAG: TIM barrel protein [Thermacetogeniaceae bacterium]
MVTIDKLLLLIGLKTRSSNILPLAVKEIRNMQKGEDAFRFGIEINLNVRGKKVDEELSAAERMKEYVVENGLAYAVHLPPADSLSSHEAEVIAEWLKRFGAEYAVMHGCTGNGVETEEEYRRLMDATVEVFSVFKDAGIPVHIENVTIPFLDNGVPNYALRTGVLAGDILEIVRRAGCDVLIDTEHLLVTMRTVKNWSIGAKHQKNGNGAYAVSSGEIVYFNLNDLTLNCQLELLKARRYHVTGSSAFSPFPHKELNDEPFARYLLATVLSMNPLSITIESCYRDKNMKFDPEVPLRSLRKAADIIRRLLFGLVGTN